MLVSEVCATQRWTLQTKFGYCIPKHIYNILCKLKSTNNFDLKFTHNLENW